MEVADVEIEVVQASDDDPLSELGFLVFWSKTGVQRVENSHKVGHGVGVFLFDLVRPRIRSIRS